MLNGSALAQLATHFAEAPATFTTSPLYRALSPVVAGDEAILEMLAQRRGGQQPSYLFFAAVHQLLLQGAAHPLRRFYPSLVGDAAADPTDAGPVLIDFCRAYRAELEHLVQTRLVQTNVVRRAIGLRYALWAIGRRCPGPVHLIEVGASAGLLLAVDRFGYRLDGYEFGRPGAAVMLDAQWRGVRPPPDLDDTPPIASRLGVDLAPVDLGDPREREWLRALVWPEDLTEAALLTAAIDETLQDCPTVLAGDAIDVCPELAHHVPPGETRVVFHAATRMHVPIERRAALDRAIDALGEDGPLYHAWIEPSSAPHYPWQADPRGTIEFHGPGDAEPTSVVRVDGHLQWLEALEPGSGR